MFIKNIYENVYKDKELFLFSNYPKNWKYYNDSNNLIPGKMKDVVSL